MKKYLSLIILSLLVVGCKPRPSLMAYAPEGPPEYVQAWNDGCESGMSAYGNIAYKMAYHFKQDVRLIDNDVYYKTWTDSFNYCRHYMNRMQKDGMLWGEGGNPADDIRDSRDSVGPGFALPGWGGYSLTDWNESTEGSDLSWLGGKKTDWLGREVSD